MHPKRLKRIDDVLTIGYNLLMNDHFTLHDIDFGWDRQKALVNLAKHDVSFESACEVFFDPMLLLVKDEVLDNELRTHLIGMTVNWRVLYVIYVMRDETVRIISARRAEPYERKRYENQ